MSHDLRAGIPFETSTIDAVYHSHVFEHIDRTAIPGFLNEVRRVLKPGGVQRIVVPDLEVSIRDYVDSIRRVDAGEADPGQHDRYVHEFVEQMVRREAAGSAAQSPGRRRLESLLLGDARKRGETHQWMWDRINLAAALTEAGFQDPTVVDYQTSSISDWPSTGLDQQSDGTEYRPRSLYMEALR
jgi:SAM-dependent methyltransferase